MTLKVISSLLHNLKSNENFSVQRLGDQLELTLVSVYDFIYFKNFFLLLLFFLSVHLSRVYRVLTAIKKKRREKKTSTLCKLPVSVIPWFEAITWFGTRPQSCFICQKVPRAGGRGFNWPFQTSPPPLRIRIDAVQLDSLTLP